MRIALILFFIYSISYGQVKVDRFTRFAATGGVPVIESWTSNYTSTEESTISVNVPTGVQADDGLIIIVGIEQTNSDTYFDDVTYKPSGFDLIQYGGSITSDVWIAGFSKVATGSESGSFSISTPGTYSGNMFAYAIRVSGINTSNIIGQTGTFNDDFSVSTGDALSVTTATDNELAFAVIAVDGSDLGTISVSGTGWTLGDQDNDGNASATGVSAAWAYKEQETAGATGNATFSWTGTDGFGTFQFSIRSQ